MKKYTYIIIALVILCGFGIFKSIEYSKLSRKYDTAIQNNKAYESQLDILNEENKVFQFTIEQLEYLNDSTIKELDSVRKELKIKDSKIKQMGKIKEYVYVTDSITVHDTIFKDPEFVLDTMLGDEWYLNNIHLKYPNEISSSVAIKTDQSVFLHTTRETINPPKKTWLGRLFQKKHDVYNVTVVEHNPYANIKENKFVIIK